jgi:hypothetical protein
MKVQVTEFTKRRAVKANELLNGTLGRIVSNGSAADGTLVIKATLSGGSRALLQEIGGDQDTWSLTELMVEPLLPGEVVTITI